MSAIAFAKPWNWAPNSSRPPAPIASRFDQPLPSMPSQTSPLTLPVQWRPVERLAAEDEPGHAVGEQDIP